MLFAALVNAAERRPEPPGWWAGDPHVHCDCGIGGGLTVTPADLRKAMETNHLAVISVLADMGNGELRDAARDLPKVNGRDDPLSTPERILHWDAEWHFDPRGVTFEQKAIGGHLIVLGLASAERRFARYTYPILEWARKQNAVAGFAHAQYLPAAIPNDLDCCAPLEYPVEFALGTPAFLMEDVDGRDTAIQAYYRLLNCGFRPGLAAATDFPCNYRKPIGSLLTYAYVPGALTYRGWIAAIAAGRTVIARNGHREFLSLTVNGAAMPGDEVKLDAPEAVAVDAKWSGIGPLNGNLELVRNGVVVDSGPDSALHSRIAFQRSGWLAARVMDDTGHRVHTAAVFVTVGGAPVRASADDAGFFVRWIDNLIARTTPPGDWSQYLSSSRDQAHARYTKARDIYRALAQEAQAPPAITIDPAKRFQVIQGFGLNFTGPYFRGDQKRMFDTFIDDLGVTMFRVVPYLVYSDWEVTNDNDDPNVMNWEYYNDRYSTPIFETTWNAIRYLNSRGIPPVIGLMGPVPAWMLADKSTPPTHKVCNSKSEIPPLSPAMYGEFAEEVVSMVMYARFHEHLDFEYFSPFNETDCYPAEGPRIDPADANKVLAAVARRLKKEGMGDIKLVVADQAVITNDYISPILKDAELMKQVGAFGLHTYGEDSVGRNVERVRSSAYADVPVWLTEYGDLNDEDKTAENDWTHFSVSANRRALTALNQGATAIFYFDAFDDYEECARRLTFYGLYTSAGHVYAPKKRYYATRQLYHFVRPGYQRIAASADSPGMTVSAFQNPDDGSIVLVGVKERGPETLRVAISGDTVPGNWDLYVTSRNLNCVKSSAVRPSRHGVEFDVPEQAVFTLVGKRTRE
jgi:O-glycosyl hydrolase